MATAHKDSQVK